MIGAHRTHPEDVHIPQSLAILPASHSNTMFRECVPEDIPNVPFTLVFPATQSVAPCTPLES